MKNLSLLVILIIVPFLFTACKRKVDSEQLNLRGNLVYEINSEKPFSGTCVKHFDNESKQAEIEYKDGIMDGSYTEYYNDGHKSVEGEYNQGKKDGLWTRWFPNGQKSNETKYESDKMISRTSWLKDGGKEFELSFSNNSIIGVQSNYLGSSHVFNTQYFISDKKDFLNKILKLSNSNESELKKVFPNLPAPKSDAGLDLYDMELNTELENDYATIQLSVTVNKSDRKIDLIIVNYIRSSDYVDAFQKIRNLSKEVLDNSNFKKIFENAEYEQLEGSVNGANTYVLFSKAQYNGDFTTFSVNFLPRQLTGVEYVQYFSRIENIEKNK